MKLNKDLWLKTIPVSLIGLNVFAFGLAMLVLASKGVSSIDTTIIIIGHFSKLPYSGAVIIIQIIYLILVLLFNKKTYNYKELIVTTVLIFIFSSVVRMYEIILETFNFQATYTTFFIGFIFYIYGLAVVVQTDVFILPLDKFLNLIANRFGKTYGPIKLINDVTLLVFSMVVIFLVGLDIPITLWTFFLTFFVGPLISACIKLNIKILNKFKK